VLCLDRRTGRLLVHQEDLQSQVNFYEITADASQRMVTLAIPGYSFSVSFTDQPTPPQPPAQMGSADRHEALDRMGRVAESVLEALSDDERAEDPFEAEGQPPAKDANRPRQ
jgi:hypothetical protein